MKLENVFMAFAIFGIVMFAGYFLFVEHYINYNASADETIFAGLNETKDQAISDINSLEDSSDPEIGDEDTDIALYKSTLSGVKSSKSIKGRISDTLMTAIKNTGNIVPSWLINSLIGLLGITITAFIVYMAFRFKPAD